MSKPWFFQYFLQFTSGAQKAEKIFYTDWKQQLVVYQSSNKIVYVLVLGAEMFKISFVYQTAKLLATFISIQRVENQNYFDSFGAQK